MRHLRADAGSDVGWTGRDKVDSLGTNDGARIAPFQGWHKFKEAFTPEFVYRALTGSDTSVEHCIDPFGGSGTTGLTCSLAGVGSTLLEVNPYLVDLCRAKTDRYCASELLDDFLRLLHFHSTQERIDSWVSGLPPTFVETPEKERWIYDREVAKALLGLREGISKLENEAHIRFFTVMLGGMLVETSNVTVNGKGRRYRRSKNRPTVTSEAVRKIFIDRCKKYIEELSRFNAGKRAKVDVKQGDCLELVSTCRPADLAIFSPPYPNSFDYTDVYNLELWMLGYLTGSNDNRVLREKTLCSHVQIKRDFGKPESEVPVLTSLVEKLESARPELWSPWIPSMVSGYFADMEKLIQGLSKNLSKRGEIWMIVGDSRYAGIHVSSADIISKIAENYSFEKIHQTNCRSMRASPQQGGNKELPEQLLVLKRI